MCTQYPNWMSQKTTFLGSPKIRLIQFSHKPKLIQPKPNQMRNFLQMLLLIVSLIIRPKATKLKVLPPVLRFENDFAQTKWAKLVHLLTFDKIVFNRLVQVLILVVIKIKSSPFPIIRIFYLQIPLSHHPSPHTNPELKGSTYVILGPQYCNTP